VLLGLASQTSVVHGFATTPVTTAPTMDIVETAVAAGVFGTLVAALSAAELVETLQVRSLHHRCARTRINVSRPCPTSAFIPHPASCPQSTGPFTVFAPNDGAFAKLPSGTVENLLKSENKADLIAILTYHVVSGSSLLAEDASDGLMVTTVNGAQVEFAVDGSMIMINNASIISPDIACTNGVIHVIDSVLMPPSTAPTMDIVETAVAAGVFETLVAALSAAELVETLQVRSLHHRCARIRDPASRPCRQPLPLSLTPV